MPHSSTDLVCVNLQLEAHWYAFVTFSKTTVTVTTESFKLPVDIPAKITVFRYHKLASGSKRASRVGTWFVTARATAALTRLKLKEHKQLVVIVKSDNLIEDQTLPHIVELKQYAAIPDADLEKQLCAGTEKQTYRPDSFKYVHRTALDPELPCTTTLPVTAGMYHVNNNSLTIEELAEAFQKAVDVATAICTNLDGGIPEATDRQYDNALECLFVLTLRVFAGSYPPCAEDRDDRHLRYLKLMTNGDCDDMSITVCSFFNSFKKHAAMIRLRLLEATDESLPAYHAYNVFNKIDNFKTCYVVMGEVDLSVATAGKKPNELGDKLCGHVWCMLERDQPPASKLRYVHMECTRFTYCHHESVSEEWYPKSLFKDRSNAMEGSYGVSPLDVKKYTQACALYTGEHTYLLKEDQKYCMPYHDLFKANTRTTFEAIVVSPEVRAHIKRYTAFCHKPNMSDLAILYTQFKIGPVVEEPIAVYNSQQNGFYSTRTRGNPDGATMVYATCVWYSIRV